jgi:hypothetical protein
LNCWVQTQSESGNADALWELYLAGGGSKSKSNLNRLCLAAQTGLVNAADELAVLRMELSPEEIAEADQLISNWQPGQCTREISLKVLPTKFLDNSPSE